jgi:glucose-6-phosphate isomerase
MWHSVAMKRGIRDMVVIPYKDRLELFSRYLQQLIMESLGKERDLAGGIVHEGLAVYGNKGSTDQHAYVQQLRDGFHNFFVTFIQVLTDADTPDVEVEPGVTAGDYLHGFLLGTRDALDENGRNSMTITLQNLSPRSLGALIALFERAVGLHAFLANINAYNQPGVEAGKIAAAEVVELQRATLDALASVAPEGFTAEQLAVKIDRPAATERIFKILEHMAANPRRGIQRTEHADPRQTRFSHAQ